VRLEGYEISAEIGRGGMGAVYRARAADGRDVAIKVLLRATPDARARFERERRLLGSLGEAEGFVPLLDAGNVGEQPFLVMPFLAGGTLRDRLRHGPLGVEDTIALGAALADAVGRAHARGIVHRDLKPENVLFDAQERPLVADLGLGKHFRSDVAGASQSVAISLVGGMRGTVGYCPSEQINDATSVDARADVFALGAILYECLAGRPAFEGETPLAVFSKIDAGHIAPLRELRPEAPERLARVVTRALARDRGNRFEDGAALARALRDASALDGAPGEGLSTGKKAFVFLLLGFVAVIAGVLASRGPWRQRADGDRAATEETATTAPIDSLVEEAGEALFRSDTASAEQRLREAFTRDARRTSSALVALSASELERFEHVQSIVVLARRMGAILPGDDAHALEDVAVASSALALLREKTSGVAGRNLAALKEQCGERDPLPAPLAAACAALYDRALKPSPSTKHLVELFPLLPGAEQRAAIVRACMEEATADMERAQPQDYDLSMERMRTDLDLLRVAARWDPRIGPLPREFRTLFVAVNMLLEQQPRRNPFLPSPGHLGYPTHPYAYFIAAHDARETIELFTIPPVDSAARAAWERVTRSDERKAELERSGEALFANVRAGFEAMSPEKDPARRSVLERWLAGELLSELVRGQVKRPEVGPLAERLAVFAGTREAWENAANVLHALGSPDRESAATDQARKAPALDSF
jgi:hypothetical protein